MPLRVGSFGLLPVVEVDAAVLDAFRCGKPHLDDFLSRRSVALHRSRLGLTSVVFHEDEPGRAIAYFTLSNDGLPLATSEQFELGVDKYALSSFPAVKLGRLAVVEDLQGAGVGEQVMELVHGEVLDSQSLSAARLVIVDADNDPRVLRFYEKLGYANSQWAQQQAQNHRPGRRNGPPGAVKMLRDVLS